MSKTNGGDEIPFELLQILKHDSVNGLNSIWQKIRELSSDHRTGKAHFSFQSQRRALPKMFKLPYYFNHFTC